MWTCLGSGQNKMMGVGCRPFKIPTLTGHTSRQKRRTRVRAQDDKAKRKASADPRDPGFSCTPSSGSCPRAAAWPPAATLLTQCLRGTRSVGGLRCSTAGAGTPALPLEGAGVSGFVCCPGSPRALCRLGLLFSTQGCCRLFASPTAVPRYTGGPAPESGSLTFVFNLSPVPRHPHPASQLTSHHQHSCPIEAT